MSDKELIKMLKDEIEWFRSYGEFVSVNYSSVDAEACSYADGDYEEEDNNQEEQSYYQNSTPFVLELYH